MRSSFVARALALATLAAAGCDGSADPDEAGAPPAPAPTTEPALLPAGVPVIVANTAASPVVTQATGTTTVAGTVTASQGGAWNVRINNASLPVEGTVAVSGGTVAATQQGPWSVDVSSPVAIAPGASVAVSELPPVTLAGTPQVTLAGAPQVTVAGTPSVTIAGAAQALPVTGAVTIANQPAVQEVSGTVELQPKQTRWDTVLVPSGIGLPLTPLPEGLVLTDLEISSFGGVDCVVSLLESIDHGSGIRTVMVWRLTAEHSVASMHLQQGISARPHFNNPVQFGLKGIEGCAGVFAIWSGYLP